MANVYIQKDIKANKPEKNLVLVLDFFLQGSVYKKKCSSNKKS